MKKILLIVAFFPLLMNAQITSFQLVTSSDMYTEVSGFTEAEDGYVYFFDNSGNLFVYKDDTISLLDFSCSSCNVADIAYEGNNSVLVMTEWKGLIRYADGVKTTVYSNISNYNAVCVASNGDIYVGSDFSGSSNKGIGVSTDNGSTFTFTKSSANGLPSDVIYDLAADKMGNIWIGTYNKLARLQSGTYTRYTNSALSANIYDVAVSINDDVWVQSAYGGIGKIDNDNLVNFGNYFSSFASTSKVAADSKGYGWTVQDKVLKRISATDSLEFPLSMFGITQSNCRSLFIDSKDRLYVAMAYRTDILVIQLDYQNESTDEIFEESRTLLNTNATSWSDIFIGNDINGDSTIDFFGLENDKLHLYLSNNSGYENREISTNNYFPMEILDFDGDGDLDLMSEEIEYYANDGSNNFETKTFEMQRYANFYNYYFDIQGSHFLMIIYILIIKRKDTVMINYFLTINRSGMDIQK